MKFNHSNKTYVGNTHIFYVELRLAEAVVIPHQKGQAEIEIPDKIKHYDEWIFSKEYRERVAKVKSRRNK